MFPSRLPSHTLGQCLAPVICTNHWWVNRTQWQFSGGQARGVGKRLKFAFALLPTTWGTPSSYGREGTLLCVSYDQKMNLLHELVVARKQESHTQCLVQGIQYMVEFNEWPLKQKKFCAMWPFSFAVLANSLHDSSISVYKVRWMLSEQHNL